MKNLRKSIFLLLSFVLAMTILAGCSSGGSKGNAKTGLAVISSVSKANDAGDDDGLVQTDSTAAAVLVDEKGVITDCVIDVVQTKINFSATGEITTDLSTTYVSKHELGDDYNMRGASPIGKEWNEQADALATYIIGKTIDEVKGMKIEDGVPAEADLESSVTMQVSDMVAAVEKAVANAEDLGASSSDKIGLGITSDLGKSKNAGDDDGTAQAYSHYAAVTLDKDNKITSSIVDASQANVKFSAEGVVTETPTKLETKLELGDGYNMKGASPIGKEWFEQSKAFTDHIVGKTISEVTGMALTDGAPSDLESSVTITVGGFLSAIEKAGASAAK